MTLPVIETPDPDPAMDRVVPDGLAPPRALLFDWDNTLVDSWPCIHRSITVLMERMGKPPWTMEETKRRVGRSMRDTFPEMFGERWMEARDIFLDAFRALHLEMLAVLDGVPAMLEGLAARGVPMGLVSNKTGALLRREVAALGWESYFFAQVGAGDAARDKPAPEAVMLALSSAPTGPRRDPVTPGPDVWFVGDTPTDMACAHATGCAPVLLRGWAPEAGEFAEYPPLVYLSHGDHLMKVVAGLLGGTGDEGRAR
ncbi:HAD family hydrolase [Roseospira visakhapatnamensis]|uniref:phosphoglycolate phosphatase n=1 Tax=Roseospira visakhapatnamensis TaxID=390880 RepID=A0A7W6RBE8_9PROT|nr:HAD family hydrolase [Roseospira visakhapatnamensis]MBB4265335.1 phosphoglycolate phosphatase [Roseospira visakhapatnamensis]